MILPDFCHCQLNPEEYVLDEIMTEKYGDRHPGTVGLLKFFEFGHLPANLQGVSSACKDLAQYMVSALPDNPELTTGLRKLLEAKDCFVRAAL